MWDFWASQERAGSLFVLLETEIRNIKEGSAGKWFATPLIGVFRGHLFCVDCFQDAFKMDSLIQELKRV